MTDRDAPDADRYEQEQPVAPGSEGAAAAAGAEVPEADALEQARPTGPEARLPTGPSDIEVPEADALEQAEEVVDDEEEWSRG